MDIRVVFDPEPDGPPATLRTARAAWAAVADGATHHLVLQDDVLLCRDFPRVVAQALQTAPDGAVSLFASWSMGTAQAMRLAALTGASWTKMVDGWTPTQALVLPAWCARGFAAYARRQPAWMPDNRVMHSFLAEQGVDTHVSIPCLVEHAPARSLLVNDLLHGVRDATAFAGDTDMSGQPFTARVVSPPAVSCMWMGAGEFFAAYDPLDPTGRSMVTPVHEVLEQFGMTGADLARAFAADREHHPELADYPLVGECFQFSLWLTMFTSGIIAGSLFDAPDPDAPDPNALDPGVLDKAFEQPWAGAAFATFPAAALRKMASYDSLRGAAGHFVPFCRTALRSGLAALSGRPGLAALWEPGRYEIKPRWARAA